MRIAQVAPLYESVPPKYYGGTERVVSYLTEELVRQGHEVTLFASGDSVTKAHLVAACRRSLRMDKHCVDRMAHHILMLEHMLQRVLHSTRPKEKLPWRWQMRHLSTGWLTRTLISMV